MWVVRHTQSVIEVGLPCKVGDTLSFFKLQFEDDVVIALFVVLSFRLRFSEFR
jgi:hypothetical protein